MTLVNKETAKGQLLGDILLRNVPIKTQALEELKSVIAEKEVVQRRVDRSMMIVTVLLLLVTTAIFAMIIDWFTGFGLKESPTINALGFIVFIVMMVFVSDEKDGMEKESCLKERAIEIIERLEKEALPLWWFELELTGLGGGEDLVNRRSELKESCERSRNGTAGETWESIESHVRWRQALQSLAGRGLDQTVNKVDAGTMGLDSGQK